MRAAIDVGSNTVRLIVAEVGTEGLVPHEYRRAVTRLGGGFSSTGGLAPDAMERTLDVLADFCAALDAAGITGLRMAGTEVVRKAVNREDFLDRVRERTGHALEILSGAEEARLSARGVLAGIEHRNEPALIFDLGGASLEFVLVAADGHLLWSHSQPLGVVTLAECGGAERRRQRISAALEVIRIRLQRDHLLEKVCGADVLLVGTAGTVTTLAAMELGLEIYSGKAVNQAILTLPMLRRWQARLANLSPGQCTEIVGLEAGREDLILPGIEVLLAILVLVDKNGLTVSDSGLLEGLLLEQA